MIPRYCEPHYSDYGLLAPRDSLYGGITVFEFIAFYFSVYKSDSINLMPYFLILNALSNKNTICYTNNNLSN